MDKRQHQWWVLAGIVLVSLTFSKGVSWWAQERAASTVKQHAKVGDIVMYSTTTCPYCAKARAWLDGHQIPWRECNIDLDKTCQQTFDAQGAPGTPLIYAKGRWHLGFDTDWLGQALQMAPTGSAKPSPA
jgi:glutaredoxin